MGSFVCKGKTAAIIVREEGEYRRLYFGSTLQGGTRLGDPAACTLPVTEGFQAIRAFRPEPPQQVLLIGLGAGEVVRCRRHFALPATRRLRVAIGDGYAFLLRSRERYDLIILDACGPDGVPSQFVRQAARRFSECYAMRLISPSSLNRLLFCGCLAAPAAGGVPDGCG